MFGLLRATSLNKLSKLLVTAATGGVATGLGTGICCIDCLIAGLAPADCCPDCMMTLYIICTSWFIWLLSCWRGGAWPAKLSWFICICIICICWSIT